MKIQGKIMVHHDEMFVDEPVIITEDYFEELEEILIMADLGVNTVIKFRHKIFAIDFLHSPFNIFHMFWINYLLSPFNTIFCYTY